MDRVVFLTEDKHIYRMLYRICPIVSSPHTIVPTHTIHIEDGNCIYLCNILYIYCIWLYFHTLAHFIGVIVRQYMCIGVGSWNAHLSHCDKPRSSILSKRWSQCAHDSITSHADITHIYIQSGVRFFFKGDCDIAVNVKLVFDAVLRTHDLSIDILWRTLRNEVPSLSRIDHMCSVVSCVTIYV